MWIIDGTACIQPTCKGTSNLFRDPPASRTWRATPTQSLIMYCCQTHVRLGTAVPAAQQNMDGGESTSKGARRRCVKWWRAWCGEFGRAAECNRAWSIRARRSAGMLGASNIAIDIGRPASRVCWETHVRAAESYTGCYTAMVVTCDKPGA
jgi:hypothetical protein